MFCICLFVILPSREVSNFKCSILVIRKILAYRVRGGQIVAFPSDYSRFRVRIPVGVVDLSSSQKIADEAAVKDACIARFTVGIIQQTHECFLTSKKLKNTRTMLPNQFILVGRLLKDLCLPLPRRGWG